ncbi:MAG TPA: TIGR04282 family arsenosugar biosynthesis glycosyltransferase [Chthoniobacterales bacterium]|nr:TIGR04282 family arsenosugar biosynthesis glycosyltransferase [Chthoniobacterales bacterium]
MPAPHRILDPANPTLQLKVCALAVMTKAPRAGQVKTRLVPPLTHEEAAQLNACFLRDTAAAIQEACGQNAVGVGVYTPIGSEAIYTDILPLDFQLLPQCGDGFGERLALAADDLFRCGFDSVCLIDSDSPTVSADVYRRAVAALSQSVDRVVLGPSDDGGYYLIGLNQTHRELFEGIDWSTERVFDQTHRRARDLSLEVIVLANGYDVDDAATLRRLRDELLSDESDLQFAPDTRKFLVELRSKKRF